MKQHKLLTKRHKSSLDRVCLQLGLNDSMGNAKWRYACDKNANEKQEHIKSFKHYLPRKVQEFYEMAKMLEDVTFDDCFCKEESRAIIKDAFKQTLLKILYYITRKPFTMPDDPDAEEEHIEMVNAIREAIDDKYKLRPQMARTLKHCLPLVFDSFLALTCRLRILEDMESDADTIEELYRGNAESCHPFKVADECENNSENFVMQDFSPLNRFVGTERIEVKRVEKVSSKRRVKHVLSTPFCEARSCLPSGWR